MKLLLYAAIGMFAWIIISEEEETELKKDFMELFSSLKDKSFTLYEAFVELLDDLEGTHSDEVRANISKRMTELQTEIGLTQKEENITGMIKNALKEIRDDIEKGVKK